MASIRRLLPQTRWKRWLLYAGVAAGFCFAMLVVLIIAVILVFRSPKFHGWLISQSLRGGAVSARELQGEPPPPTTAYSGPDLDARALASAGQLFQSTNIWSAHLRFSAEQWAALGPNHVEPLSGWLSHDGTPNLNNPKASRNGLAGVVGLEFPWSQAEFEFGGVGFTNVGVRFKGNGTFLSGMGGFKRPFKVDLNKHVDTQRLVGRGDLNLHNLSADASFLSDTLAYEYFRDAGVPAPRTAFARLYLTIDGRFERRWVGLYLLVENPDGDWAREFFGAPGAAIFKPVTYELFSYLGEDWSAYERTYDPKTKTSAAQRQRVIDFARHVTQASDDAFEARLGEFIDIGEVARFLAAEVLLTNYDGILSNGQNFLLYLDPQSSRFGLIPWDQDHSWGEFPFVATAADRERASIRRPWVGSHRLLERLLACAAFRDAYRAELERQLATLFVPERLNQRIDERAAAIRPAVAEESPHLRRRFETAVADQATAGPRDGNPMDPNHPVHQYKRFISGRAKSVRDQLDGKSEGVVLRRKPVM